MCNPRRVRVRGTRALHEAWEREISRTATLTEQVVGEARVRQSLDLGGPALTALERYLGTPESGWETVEGGYRFSVEGGHVTYRARERALEIVAALSDEVTASGRAQTRLSGEVHDDLHAEGEGKYYHDGYGGRTRERAEQEAGEEVERNLDEAARVRLEQEAAAAEADVDEALRAGAQAEAIAALRRVAEARRAELAAAARQRLESVGVRCRRAWHAALACAYRDAILAYARDREASGVACREDGNVVEIEFCMRG